MAKKKSKKNDAGDIPRNKAILIALAMVGILWYVVNQPLATGILLFLLLLVAVLGITAYIIFTVKGGLLGFLKR